MSTAIGRYLFFNLLYVLEIECGRWDESDLPLEIRITAWDASGRDSSLLYDGGSAQIMCWSNTERKAIELHVANDTSYPDFVKINADSRRDGWLTHTLIINSAALSKIYKCWDGVTGSAAITITYVLCDPRLIKPKKVCSKPNEFCHITPIGSAKCKRLSSTACFYGDNLNDFIRYRQPAVVLPKFKKVCLENPLPYNPAYGLCYSLSNANDLRVRFLNIRDTCNYNLSIYICKDIQCKNRKKLWFAEWDFVDLAHPFSMSIDFRTSSLRVISCSATDMKNNTARPDNPAHPGHYSFGATNEMTSFTNQLRQFSTPTIADIVCKSKEDDGSLLKYQTNLLLFRSNRDVNYTIEEEMPVNTGGIERYGVTISATVADGLYVCLQRRKRMCTPSQTITNTATLSLDITGREPKTFMFYIGVFASSYKKQYVLIFEDTVNRTFHKSQKDSKAEIRTPVHSKAPEHPTVRIHPTAIHKSVLSTDSSSFTPQRDKSIVTTWHVSANTYKMTRTPVWWLLGVTIAVLVVAIGIVAFVIISISLSLRNRSKQRQDGGAKDAKPIPTSKIKSPPTHSKTTPAASPPKSTWSHLQQRNSKVPSEVSRQSYETIKEICSRQK